MDPSRENIAKPAWSCVNGTESRGKPVNILAYFRLSVSLSVSTIDDLGMGNAASSCTQPFPKHLRNKVRTTRRKKFADQWHCAAACRTVPFRPFMVVS